MKKLNNLTLGTVFRSRKNANQPTRSTRTTHLIDDKSNFNIREAYKIGRTNIRFALPEEECSTLIVTSSWPMEGKTTNCINLAIAFSQTGAKTLLIDCDLRKPRIAKVFGITSKMGLSNTLRNFCSVSDAIHTTQYENLSVMPSGHIPPNPAELLSSQEMQDMLSELKKEYRYILIDTPPVNLLADALLLASNASGTVMVARQGVTDHKSLQEALDKLNFSGAKVLGFVLNDAHEDGGSYYRYNMGYGRYGYYKKQYYGRGYEYSNHKKQENKAEQAELLKKIRQNSQVNQDGKIAVQRKTKKKEKNQDK